jgi:hypothetical protein
MKMLYQRGDHWNGHYAYNDIDEVAYASYVRALIDGRPRKNDPYSGRDDTPETPQPESLFSIQFAAPYTIAIPASIASCDNTNGGELSTLAAALVGFGDWAFESVTTNSTSKMETMDRKRIIRSMEFRTFILLPF